MSAWLSWYIIIVLKKRRWKFCIDLYGLVVESLIESFVVYIKLVPELELRVGTYTYYYVDKVTSTMIIIELKRNLVQ